MLRITATTEKEQALCPIRNVLAKINGKWQPLIIFSLEDGAQRFSAVKRLLDDITQRVLTENLRNLERDGYIIRHVKNGPPVEVSYELTKLGETLLKVLKPMFQWATISFPAVKQARSVKSPLW